MQGIYDVTLLPGKLVITEEPYVNPTAVSRSGDYLDIDVENWNLDTCPYADLTLIRRRSRRASWTIWISSSPTTAK